MANFLPEYELLVRDEIMKSNSVGQSESFASFMTQNINMTKSADVKGASKLASKLIKCHFRAKIDDFGS